MSTTSREERISGYLYALDGLRALSLLMIVTFHTWQQSWISYYLRLNATTMLFNLDLFQRYGYVAIDSFFVLSGFCMFYPVARDMFGERKFGGWKDFFIKRLRRIYPAYAMMLLLLLIFPKLSWITNGMTNPAEIAKHFLSHLFLVHTYNSATLGSTISTAWTLPIETQFYLLLPLLCIPFRKKPLLTFLGMAIAGVGVRLGLMCYTDITQMTIQAIPLGYLDVFGWGMISAYFVVYIRNRVRNVQRLKPLMTLASAACLLAGLGYMIWLSKMRPPSGLSGGDVYFRFLYRGLFAAVMAGFLLTACFSYSFWERKIWGNRFFIFLSSISYTVYLWHQNIYILLKRINVPYTTESPVMHDRHAMEGMTLLCLLSSLIIGVVVTKYIEGPIVRYGYKGCALKIWHGLRVLTGKKPSTAGTEDAEDTGAEAE